MINLRDLNKEERINTLIEHHFNYNSALSSISSVSFVDSHTSIDELKEFFEGIQEKTIYIATSPAFDLSQNENGKEYFKSYNVNTHSYNSIEQAIIKMMNMEEYECIVFYSISKNSISFQVGFNLRYAIIEDEIAKKIIERDNKIDSILKNKK
jgi:hypothetical protein